MNRRYLFLTLICFAIVASIASRQTTEAASHKSFGGPPYNVGAIVTPTTTSPESEEMIASDPGPAGNLVSAVTDFSVRTGAGTTKVTVSADGGSTWNETFVPLSGIFPTTSDNVTWLENRDPSVVIDNQASAYIGGIYQVLAGGQSNRVNPASGFYVCRGTLPNLVLTSDACNPVATSTLIGNNPTSEDKSTLAVDNSSSAFTGNVYAAWVHFTGCRGLGQCTSKSIAFSRSVDHGLTWSPLLTVSKLGTNVQWPQIVVGSDGTIYLGYEVLLRSGMGQHFLAISSDGGVSFTPAQQITPPYAELTFNSTYRKNSAPSLAVSPVSGAEYVWDVFAVQKGSVSNIVYSRSKLPKGLGGFTLPVSLSDTAVGQRFFPAAAVDATGTLNVAWFDTRNSRTVAMYDVYATYTQNLGGQFAPNTRVTPLLINAGGSEFIGDYIGMSVDPLTGVAHAVWSNNQLQTTTLTIP